MNHPLLRQSSVSLLSGLLFGAGLAIASMTDPAKVQNFLDLAGHWDPSLVFVMASGIAVMALVYPVLRQCRKPVVGGHFDLPTRTELTPRLLIGSALFGIGWGLVGLCPGPAITGLLQGHWEFYLFAVSMIAAMKMYTDSGLEKR